ncbi:uncharacterized protein LOC107656114 [Sinocyclocheilus anshuiensis]|uniref:uncharacterized protein LOC107656114 n=1 Tax=Sinocyclocheilus anshuiensis TaxID=1608454 RepID=UPI0007BAAE38|nr:PREDICTED: uncharacterized protein LOC107656114 [Sinocyclocheilus anshuiensis]
MTTKQTGTHQLGRRPVIQGPRPQLGKRGWVEKLATGVEGKGEGEKKLKAAIDFLKIGTWNVRTLRSPGKLELLRKEMTPYECDILGLAEMRWTGVGELNGGEVIWSGEEKNHMRGVGFLLSKRAKDALLGYNPVNSRNIVTRFNGAPLNIAVIQVYAPTSDSTEEEVETFYGQLEHTIEELPKKDVKIVIGDWNAKVGTDNLGWEQVMGCHSYGQRNNRGERLLEFASKNDLLITNTRFQQKDSRKWTWMAPDGKYTNMIDLVLVDRRWKTAVCVCRTFQGADISSDHSLVMCKLKLRLKRTTRQQRHEPRRNIDALGNATVRAAFKDKVEQRLANSPSQPVELNDRVRQLNEAIQSSVREVLPTVCKQNKPWITEHTLQLAKTKREMKERRQESEEREKEYRVVCNVVRKAAKTDKEEWLQRQCQEIERLAGDNRSREAYKLINQINRAWKPKQSAIEDKNGKMLQDKAEVKKRWTEYCRGLYTDRANSDTVITELDQISPPPNEDEMHYILYEEVAEAVKRLKKGKSPGIDDITGEMIQAGGEKLQKRYTQSVIRYGRKGEYQRNVQSIDDGVTGEIESADGTTSVRGAGRIQERQMHDTSNPDSKAYGREDDIDLLEEDRVELQGNLDRINEAGEAAGLQINIEKTMTMVFGQEDIEEELEIRGRSIENVTEFVYLGSLLTWDNDCSKEIKRRIARATGVMAGFKTIWNSKHIRTETKISIIRTCVMSVLLYACETWTLRKKDKDLLRAFEMKCYRRILHIHWHQKITNVEVQRRVGNTRNIVQLIMERKLSLFGLICRMEDK